MYASTRKFLFSLIFLALLYLFFLPAYMMEPSGMNALMAVVVLAYGLWLLISGFRWRKRELILLEAAQKMLSTGSKKISIQKLASDHNLPGWAVQVTLLSHQRKGKLDANAVIDA